VRKYEKSVGKKGALKDHEIRTKILAVNFAILKHLSDLCISGRIIKGAAEERAIINKYYYYYYYYYYSMVQDII
jgi:hypothetical protein